MSRILLRIAVPSPLRRLFDYLPPAEPGEARPGQRYLVPFGSRQVVGILLATTRESSVPHQRLKPALRRLDEEPLWSPDELALLAWAIDYYHHAPGEVLQNALPVLLRQPRPARGEGIRRYRLTAEGCALDPAQLGRAPRQAALLSQLSEAPDGFTSHQLDAALQQWRPAARRMLERGWLEIEEGPCLPPQPTVPPTEPPLLNPEQKAAAEAIESGRDRFSAYLLEGVTGSGKTEVYLSAIEKVLGEGRQALVLVPEIGLTPQLLDRFRRRLAVPMALLHSGLADGERLCAWLASRDGSARLVIGTRSAVFAPFRDLGLIVVDEEHDASLKQQDGFRYSARDVAVVRAKRAGIPVVLGSATPSLESIHNAVQGRYHHLLLEKRAGNARPPRMAVIDMRHQPIRNGLSEPLKQAIARHLAAEGQVLVFLNRRGYAPALLCHDCGWLCQCRRCDAHMVLYAGTGRLRCQHCGSERPLPTRCADCGSTDLRPVGQGTERLEEALAEAFPDAGLVRIDRDSTRRKHALETFLDEIRSGRARLLIGTQMLAKGHHFPNVTLVAVVDADQGLFSADFRALERMAQLILQVAGRAGRAERPGEVLIQTHFPEHPLLRQLIERGYPHYSKLALAERREAALPPFAHLALLRAEAVGREAPLSFLEEARALAEQNGHSGVWLLGPVPAPMERRAGRFRAHLLLQADQRAPLHRLLSAWIPQLEALKSGRKVRWSLDVDPAELF